MLKFIAAGLVNTLVGSGAMFLLYNAAGCGYWLSSAISYVIGSIVSFFLNKYWTFRVRKWSAFMIAAFAANIGICYLIAYGFAKPAVYALFENRSARLRDNVALFTGMCLFTALNYCGQRFVVFRQKKEF